MIIYDKMKQLKPDNDDYDDSWAHGFDAGRDAAINVLLEELIFPTMQPTAWIFRMPTGRGLSFYDPNLHTAAEDDARPAEPLFSRNQLLGGDS